MTDVDTGNTSSEREQRPLDPDDPSKPESPDDLTRASWMFVLRKTAFEFRKDQCLDLAAALTYYAVLSLFPALLVLVSLLGVIGEGRRTTDALVDVAAQLVPDSALDMLRQPIQQVVDNPSAGVALVVSALAALWSASGYIGAFGRAMNRIYEIGEGRPMWKLRPQQMLLTLAGLLLAAATGFLLIVSGPISKAIGGAIGLGSAAQTAWAVAKWPVVLLLVTLAVAMLYYATPNIQQPKFRWLSLGAAVAIVVWALASLGFGLYVSRFGSYDKTYGAVGGVIVFLLWLWITNVALLFGAELDAELERGRQLQAGIAAEHELQLPPKDTRVIEKNEAAERKDIARGRWLRRNRGRNRVKNRGAQNA
ncbi:YihY/virulence factor BrkB family protein [Mycobacterium bourgelatii]|uniref:Ribonuclease n=1 Tax=Mycobacterium bourgelatii TaxID=1273442 RepID=A0A7I9YQE0_MYCBU|nr:YihY/virulence factor BrkB family protein [Mycobacterium bourgelatii]MCV6973962.1 YihY/virulence factor BrkB family protein [Mycobacterium bourgelatii]GFG90895.1 ribonuclease [Mycobacterium bourgelatii]